MTDKVIVLGAGGRFGRAAVKAFVTAGWDVRALARSWEDRQVPSGVTPLTGDAFNAVDLVRAARGTDLIVNALNPPYPRWAEDVPRLTANVIAAARASGATVLIPGNVYNYGSAMPAVLDEATPQRADTAKGQLRIEMEAAYREAAPDGVRTIVLRAGDFIERESTGNWFDGYISAKVARGRAVYPGPMDRRHAWAYLPDMAEAAVGLANKRDAFAPFEAFGFAGYSLTGAELIAAMEQRAGRALKVGRIPWVFIRLMGLFNAQMREVVEMAYLWRVPHRIDDTKLRATLPDLRSTSVEVAMADVLPVGGHAVTATAAARA